MLQKNCRLPSLKPQEEEKAAGVETSRRPPLGSSSRLPELPAAKRGLGTRKTKCLPAARWTVDKARQETVSKEEAAAIISCPLKKVHRGPACRTTKECLGGVGMKGKPRTPDSLPWLAERAREAHPQKGKYLLDQQLPDGRDVNVDGVGATDFSPVDREGRDDLRVPLQGQHRSPFGLCRAPVLVLLREEETRFSPTALPHAWSWARGGLCCQVCLCLLKQNPSLEGLEGIARSSPNEKCPPPLGARSCPITSLIYLCFYTPALIQNAVQGAVSRLHLKLGAL